MRRPVQDPLTDREIEVLGAVADGLTNAEIGRRLVIGEATVKTHLLRLFAKLDVNDRTRAVVVAMERAPAAAVEGFRPRNGWPRARRRRTRSPALVRTDGEGACPRRQQRSGCGPLGQPRIRIRAQEHQLVVERCRGGDQQAPRVRVP